VAVAVVDVRVDSSSAVRNLQQLDAASKRSQSAIAGLSGKVLGLGAALAGGFALQKIIQDVTELDRNIRRLGTVGMDVGKISPALAKLSDELGGVASKAELAAASYQAASAGFADTAGNIQILNAATKAAVGGLADTQAVTEVLVKTLNAYGMSGTRAFEVTDSISKAVELGNQEWGDYTSLLGRVVSTTALAGVSINEMNAFIASATKNGATAEVAFTGLSGVLYNIRLERLRARVKIAKSGRPANLGAV
jgi:TP901 family phage tail tape measure protein